MLINDYIDYLDSKKLEALAAAKKEAQQYSQDALSVALGRYVDDALTDITAKEFALLHIIARLGVVSFGAIVRCTKGSESDIYNDLQSLIKASLIEVMTSPYDSHYYRVTCQVDSRYLSMELCKKGDTPG